ncbi:acyl-CoA reductase [Lachnospiraceae bacterium 45-W7]
MHMKISGVEYLFGEQNIEVKPKQPYGEEQCEFLEALSKALRADKEARQYTDILTFAFWIRRANIQQLYQAYGNTYNRIGKGVVFHIAPSNVAINFAYTFAFGMITGNANIVKVSSKRFVQTTIICRVMNQLMEEERFQWVRKENAVVLYDRENQEATDYYSSLCDVRIIWGGNHTIERVRKSPLQPRSTEITFADRYSFGVISSEAILRASEQDMKTLAEGFYNDTYLMDQNACSSPHLIFWVGNKADQKKAEERFWKSVYTEAKRYELADIKVSDKYTMLCECAQKTEAFNVDRYDNLVYVVNLKELGEDITGYRGKFGLFYSYQIEDVEALFRYTNHKAIQTCAVFGIEEKVIADGIMRNHITGIDRIVKFGHTLDIGVFWDGYDIVSVLSRCIVSL